MLACRRLGKALDNRISRLLLKGKVYLVLKILLTGVEGKIKVIIARFDIGVVLPVHRERGGLTATKSLG